MTFEEHLEKTRRDDGTYDLYAAEKALAEELAQTPGEVERLAAKAAHADRSKWEKRERENLGKQMQQSALSPELELDVKVQIGKSTVVDYGEMNHQRIQLRKDLRTKVHLDENRAFDAEMTHWMQTEQLLGDGETIAEAIRVAVHG